MAGYCAIALLDDGAREKIISLQRALGRTENFSAHITLAVYDNIDEDVLVDWTKQIVKTHKPFSFFYSSIGLMYRCNVFANPNTTLQLLQLYTDFHQRYDELCVDYNSMKNGQWLQHTSIHYSYDVKEAKRIFCLAVDLFEPFKAEVVGIKVTKVLTSGYRDVYVGRFN